MNKTECDYPLSEKQLKFVKSATKYDCKVFYDYSGRGMFGRVCPAIITKSVIAPFPMKSEYRVDNMGKEYVIYCP